MRPLCWLPLLSLANGYKYWAPSEYRTPGSVVMFNPTRLLNMKSFSNPKSAKQHYQYLLNLVNIYNIRAPSEDQTQYSVEVMSNQTSSLTITQNSDTQMTISWICTKLRLANIDNIRPGRKDRTHYSVVFNKTSSLTITQPRWDRTTLLIFTNHYLIFSTGIHVWITT